MERERSDCMVVFSAVTDVRLQIERDRGKEEKTERPQGSWCDVISDVLYVCCLQLCAVEGIWDSFINRLLLPGDIYANINMNPVLAWILFCRFSQ